MLIENMMYFALGLLVAGLLALVIMPAVWKRAVRLTKRRIEAATPITLSEFRADKDQLRAEFALTTRRLEMNVETLRKRLAEQLSDANLKRAELGALVAEREKHASVVSELESREIDLRARIIELEKENADLAQRLRMREREIEARQGELQASLTDDQPPSEDRGETEALIASAEDRFNALLADGGQPRQSTNGRSELLADKLSLEDELERLRSKIGEVESTIAEDWGTDEIDEEDLRERLNDITGSVSRLVYAVDNDAPLEADDPEESLFDRVQRFADDGESMGTLEPPKPQLPRRGSVSDRLAAVREIQGR